jgi:hypothetical protein
LTACGGGTTGFVSFATLSVLGNGDGVVRAISSNGEEFLIYTPEVREVVASANSAATRNVVNSSASDFPIIYRDEYVILRYGTVTSEGITFNVSGVQDRSTTDAAVLFFEMPAGMNDVSMVTGPPYRNVPSGEFTYFGTQMSTPRNTIAPGSDGRFALVADFDNRAFGYYGTSGNLEVAGGGALDTSNGRFASSTMSMTTSNTTYIGRMYGLLHGNGATATSGVFYSCVSCFSPAYTGAFVGSKD